MEAITTGTVSVTALPSKNQPDFKNPNDVEFEVKYPEDYKGPKIMPEGKVTISKESAEVFTMQGIGKVVEDKEAEPVKDVTPSIDQSTGSNSGETGKQKTSKSKNK